MFPIGSRQFNNRAGIEIHFPIISFYGFKNKQKNTIKSTVTTFENPFYGNIKKCLPFNSFFLLFLCIAKKKKKEKIMYEIVLQFIMNNYVGIIL